MYFLFFFFQSTTHVPATVADEQIDMNSEIVEDWTYNLQEKSYKNPDTIQQLFHGTIQGVSIKTLNYVLLPVNKHFVNITIEMRTIVGDM